MLSASMPSALLCSETSSPSSPTDALDLDAPISNATPPAAPTLLTRDDLRALPSLLALSASETAKRLGVPPGLLDQMIRGDKPTTLTLSLAATALLLGARGYEPRRAQRAPAPSQNSTALPPIADTSDPEPHDPYLDFVMTVV